MDSQDAWVEKGERGLKRSVMGVRKAFELLERACVGLRGVYWDGEEGSLVVEKGTCGLKRIHSDEWEMHMEPRRANKD